MWQVLFWSSFVLCWFFLPILRIYEISGDFSWKARLKSSVKTQLREFLIVGIIGIVILLVVLIKSLVDFEDLPTILAFLSNTWGLFLVMIFLGYGLVAVPRGFWRAGNLKGNLEFLYVKLVNVDEEVTLASGNLDDAVKRVCAASSKVPRDSMLREQIDVVNQACPDSLREFHMNRGADASLITGVVTEKTLVDLHSSLKIALVEYKRSKCEWSKCVQEILTAEDILKSENSPTRRINFLLLDRSDSSRLFQYLEWAYYIKIRPVLCQFLSMFFALMSILVILGECTMFTSLPIGVFPLIVKDDLGLYLSQLLTLLPLSYIIFCTYFAFFNLKLPGLYGLYSKNTEPCSLAYCAFYLTRLSAPLALNFFYLVKVTNAVFWDVVVSSDAVGDIFEMLNTYFPCTLFFFTLLNYLNTYSKILSLLGVNQLNFIDASSAYKIKEGKALVKRERVNLERDLKTKRLTDWEMSSLEVLRDSGYGSFKI
jgi:hypothetical protein